MNNKEFIKSLIKLIFIFLVLILSISIYLTNAWYAKNTLVNSRNAVINSDTSPISLFIDKDTVSNDYKTSISTDWSILDNKGLYPISTVDCNNWYYVSQWSKSSYDDINGWVIDNSGSYVAASNYSEANITTTNGVGIYTNTAEANEDKVAYYLDEHILYTNRDTLDIYLNPSNPIELSGTCDYLLDEAIRVAIKTDTVFFIYAPFAENNNLVGNSIGSIKGNNFYGITDSELNTITVINSFIAGYGYVAQISNDDYIPGNASSLGTCDSINGLVVDVYIWLEGTDAQAIQGQSSDDKGTLTITINYVGI